MIAIIDHYSQAPGEKGNNRFIYLAKLLSAEGYEVEIITTDFSHIQKKSRTIPESALAALPYRYMMLPEPGYPKNVCVQRIFSHRRFGKNLKKYLQSRDDIQCVYISVPSLDVGKVAAQYCNERDIPLFVDIQDIWPEAFEMVLPLPQLTRHLLYPMKRLADYIYRSARYLVAVSETYLERGLSVAPNTPGLCVYLGTDLKQFDQAKAATVVQKPQGEFWVGYVGTLGVSYNIEIAVRAVQLLQEKGYKNVILKVLGDGPDLPRLKEIARGSYVDFLGRRNYEEMVGILCQCDIAVNPIVHNAPQSIINKHGDYAAAGLPVVSTQESAEYQKMIAAYDCGITCAVDDSDAVAEAIEQLLCDPEKCAKMGTNARKMAEEKFDRSITNQEIISAIKKEMYQ